LDVRATQINEAMKLAAVKSLAELARLPVPDLVNMAYNEKNILFGPNYIIPKPLDNRLLRHVAPAVAKAAMESGVARQPITDWEAYSEKLNERLGIDNHLLRMIGAKARKNPKKVVFADAENQKVLKTAQLVLDEGVAFPILIGDKEKIEAIAEGSGIDISEMQIIDPKNNNTHDKRMEFGELFFAKRQRKGFNAYEAKKIMKDRNYFGCMMVETGEADAMISGLSKNYPDTIRPALQVIGMEEGVKSVAGMYIMMTKKGPLFLADTTVNFNPTAEELANIAIMVAKEVRSFGMVPNIAMLSYSNFGSSNSPEAKLVAKAREIVKQIDPDLVIDGEMQANVAFNKEILKDNYPFSELVDKDVNVLIFPNLASGNVTYNILQEVVGYETIGPVLLGLNKPVHILQLGSHVRSIYNMVLIAVVDAQMKCKKKSETQSSEKRRWRKPKLPAAESK
jgi:malate dehydrogenase (oxaloacetate-decarboxylating)(NADP+)